MDPTKPESFHHCYTWIGDVRYHYIDQKPKDWSDENKLLLLCHGFPDFWFGWRHLIVRLVKAGYRCIVPDLKGFGETQYLKVEHEDVERLKHFSIKQSAIEMIALMDQLDGGRYRGHSLTIVGHDYGGYLVWRMAQYFPDRIKQVASFCTPYNAPNKTYVSVEQLAKITKGAWNYQVYFNSPNATAELDDNVEVFFRLFLRGPRDPPIARNPFSDASATVSMVANLETDKISYPTTLSRKEFDEYVKAYTRSSFNGGLQWYRTRRINHDDEIALNPFISQRSLMVTAGYDTALPAAMARNMPKFIKNLTMKHIEEAGHWILQEQPDECAELLLEWLSPRSHL